MQKYVSEGSNAPKVTDPIELDHPRQCFLLHHGVYKKLVEKSKLRIVFDATAEFNGELLNNSMRTGPTLLKELPEILFKFGEPISRLCRTAEDYGGSDQRAITTIKEMISIWTITWIALTPLRKLSGWEGR